MSLDDNLRSIFAKNLNAQLEKHDKTQIEVADKLGIKQSTFSSWCTGAKMPRMDKVQSLADYFGVMKSDLIEEKFASTSDDELAEEVNEVIRLYRAAPEEMRAAFRGMLKAAATTQSSMGATSRDK